MIQKFRYYLKQKKYRPHFGKDDIVMEDIILNPVHLLPEDRWLENQETDFWMDDKSDFYLLTLRNSRKHTVVLIDNEINQFRQIIVCVPVEDTFATLGKVVHQLKKFPYAQKLTEKQQTYPFL